MICGQSGRNKQKGETSGSSSKKKHSASLTFCSNRDQLHSFTSDEVERFINVGDLVDSHFASLWLGQAFTWNQKHSPDDDMFCGYTRFLVPQNHSQETFPT
ncbi:hypothetical protein AMECASPLE_037224 [Ameca splendens]|uniref:Uncharacterized protein n=1 Tax=Ameca splendens TaxID=208324 RepID=A0ABV0Z5R0_9TELE